MNYFKKLTIAFVLFSYLFLAGCNRENTIDARLSQLMHATEQYILMEKTRLETLAVEDDVLTLNWKLICPQLIETNADKIPALYWFALPDGSYYTSEKGRVEANLSDREYFPQLLQGKSVINAIITGKTSNRKSLVVAVPIKKDNQVIGILAASIYLSDLNDYLRQTLSLPENMGYFVLASDGSTILHSNDNDLIFHRADNESDFPLLQQAIKTMNEKNSGSVSYEWKGNKKTAYFKLCPLFNWRFAISKIDR